MFPNIATLGSQKKVPIVGTEELVKEWGEIKKQLQNKAKLAASKITSNLINDMLKVCKLKEISQFYCNYLVYFVSFLPENRQQEVLKCEIHDIINNRSHFHFIRDTLLLRQNLLSNVQTLMETVEGLLAINSNKPCKSSVKAKIFQMLKTATSLQQINQIQKNKITLLATAILQLRKNSVSIIQNVKKWRQFLAGLNSYSSKLSKIKIVFPKSAFNCLLLPLYDQSFIFTSFINQYFQLSDKNNPFILLGKQSKKSELLVQIFKQELMKNIEEYNQYTKYILSQIPKISDKQQFDKASSNNKTNEFNSAYDKKSKKNQKYQPTKKQSSVMSPESSKKIASPDKKNKKQLNIENILLRYRKSLKKQVQPSESNFESIQKYESIEKKNINEKQESKPHIKFISQKHHRTISEGDKIRKMLDEKAFLQKQLKEANAKNKQYEVMMKKMKKQQKIQDKAKLNKSDDSIQKSDEPVKITHNKQINRTPSNKIMAVYGKKQGRQLSAVSNKRQSIDNLVEQKKLLKKELKQQMRQKQRLQKLLKQSQIRYDKQLDSSRVQKSILESEIQSLKRSRSKVNSKLENYDDPQLLKKSKASIISLYMKDEANEKRVGQSSKINLYQDKLQQQKNQRLHLQKQIKNLMKEKTKLQRVILKQQQTKMKQKQRNQRQIQKYEEFIKKLNEQSSQNKLRNNKYDFSKQPSRLRMYTANSSQLEQQIKRRQHSKSASNIKSQSQYEKKREKMKTIINQNDDDENEAVYKKINKVQIIQTKKTIQIIYDSARKRKSNAESRTSEGKRGIDQIQKSNEFNRLKKQNKNLIDQAAYEETRKEKQQKLYQKKNMKDQKFIQNYKNLVERQKDKKHQLQLKLKNLKRQLFNEFEEKLKAEKNKFKQEKDKLIKLIEEQKGENQLKEKQLMNQFKFLNQMTQNEKYLIDLLENEKKSRIDKEKQLVNQINKKQELLKLIQIEQIKKSLQKQIRNELPDQKNVHNTEEEEMEFRKEQLKAEIQQLNIQRNAQLLQIDDQNEKLKSLIVKLKNQQDKLLSAINQSFNPNETDSNYYEPYEKKTLQIYRDEDQKLLRLSNIHNKKDELQSKKENQYDIKKISQAFQSRLKAEQEHEQNLKMKYNDIKKSPEFKQKQQVENIIQKYLQNPHQYPPSKNLNYSPEQKKQLSADVYHKNKQVGQFEKELLQIKELQKIVPTHQNDLMTSHLLSLKQAYDNQQSSLLKEELFPTIKQNQVYFESELSFEEEPTPPPETLAEEIQDHAKKHKKVKTSSKNFMAINKVRLMELQGNRRQKQKQFIQEEAKRRAKSLIMKKNMKLKQQQRKRKSLQKKQKDQQKKKIKEEELIKMKLNQQNIPTAVKYKQKKKQKKENENKSQQNNSMLKREEVGKSQQQIAKQSYAPITLLNDKISQSKTENKAKAEQQNQYNQYEQQFNDESQNSIINGEQKGTEKNQASKQAQKQQQAEKEQGEKLQNNQFMEMAMEDKKLEQQKKQLQEDVHLLQEEIRSYISGEQKFWINQEYIERKELAAYIQNLLSISSKQMQTLNNNPHIISNIDEYKSVAILVAKERINNLQVGIAIFHKQREEESYICDYVLAHNMKNFLNLLFNFSRYIFECDQYSSKTQYYFDLRNLSQELSLLNFIQFEEKCKRLGQVYVKVDSDKTRKYVLRRNLFQPQKNEEKKLASLQFNLSIEVFSEHLKQWGKGFISSKKSEYLSLTTLLSMYLKKNSQVFQVFRKSSQNDLKQRELLMTTMMFQKKELEIKNIQHHELSMQKRVERSSKYKQWLSIEDQSQEIRQMQFKIEHQLNAKTKRSILIIDSEQINYLIHYPEEPVIKIQSSNSSQSGIFLSVLPKFKVLLIEAAQFIEMNKVNPEVNVFFYIKHFIKNMLQANKEDHPRVFIPQISGQGISLLKQFSEKIKQTVIASEQIKLGWGHEINNSVMQTPSHKDLVIKKPFIISLLSASVERIIEGTPLFATVVQ